MGPITEKQIKEIMRKKLVILRGCPGSGKSSLAKDLQREYGDRCVVQSTDNYFMKFVDERPTYCFDPNLLHRYHTKNLQHSTINMASEACQVVVIDNTNTTFKEMKPYVLVALILGLDIEIKEPNTPWKFDAEELFKKNTHGVPLESIQKMLKRWEKTEDCYKKIVELEQTIGRIR